MNEENLKYPAKIITKCTESFENFWQQIQRSESLMSYLEVGNKLITNYDDEARKYYSSIYDHGYNPEIVKKSLNKNLDSLLNVKFYEIHLSSMIYVNSIDNFITYFKDVLSEVVVAKPQVLKSQESEKLDFILEHKSMDDLINSIASKKIEELFYKGIEDIEKFFQSRLGLNIFKNNVQRKNVNFYIKQRNLTVHNKRKISKEFAKQFPELEKDIGQYLNFEFGYVSKMNLTLFNFLATLDEEIAQKFKLKTRNPHT
ncbi:hypothetical protein [Psychroserpens sp. SPM9]|uniref:hypothetical protein n=1 Tax=Psychroserpens sp. SPM9 TaxID=2975598 RepID=UPI0021A6BD9E|nr:hypothetical protein [Psychroserpens sp. SPM9]MDG5493246.1 hypothetical protein [Psychroserpens sp. SPM9]